MRQLYALFALPFLIVFGIAGMPGSAAAESPSPQYQLKMVEAINAYKQKDLSKATELLNEADAIQPDNVVTINLRGAIKLEEGDTAAAGKLFLQALEKNPEFYPAKFNLAEIPFQQKNYAEARKKFEALVRENPKDELSQFKIFLTYLLEKNMDKAHETLDSIPWPGDTPAYYFSMAAWEFAHGDGNEANGWIASAKRIFRPSANAIYAQTLEEIGWLTRNMPSGGDGPVN
jgi:tetratricopeptide (TPR) repeat protein